MKTFKICDGDLIIITHGRFESSRVTALVNTLQNWVNERGLQVHIVTSDSGPKESAPEITVFTVNNVFENEVLNSD